MKLLILLCACVGLISGLNIDRKFSTTGRIIGGTDTTIEKHPWQISMFYQEVFFCGGVIFTRRWVLTAAHCVDSQPPLEAITFRAGSTLREEGDHQISNVAYYAQHPDYDSQNYAYDVAIALLQQAFIFGATADEIPLVPSGFVAAVGSDVTVTGWGYTAAGTLSQTLQEITVPIVSREVCNESWEGYVDETMICAGMPGRDSCTSDSGGPMTQNGRLVGLVSWGSSDCGNGQPGVYTNIGHPDIFDWIMDNAGR